MTRGLELVIAEREKQIKMGRDTKFDVKINNEEQLRCAGCFLPESLDFDSESVEVSPEYFLPPKWDKKEWEKLCLKSLEERLIIAASFLIAEYDRLQAIKIKELNESSNQK